MKSILSNWWIKDGLFSHKIPSVKSYPITDFVTWVVVAFTLCFFFLPLFVSAESEERGSGAREIRA